MADTILIIEDEKPIADNVVYALRTEGFSPVWCATAQAARRALKKGGIALAVLDVGLPDGNGFELCREIRAASPIPIIFLTARSAEVDRVVGLEIGGDDYVVKPFSPRELAARVRAVLRRRTAPPEKPAAPAVPFATDREKQTIAYFGTPLPLTRYEFRILDLLTSHPGRVFTRDQLMEMAWESPEASLDRTVDAHVKTLRAKLHKVRPDIDPIETRRGIGYALKESL